MLVNVNMVLLSYWVMITNEILVIPYQVNRAQRIYAKKDCHHLITSQHLHIPPIEDFYKLTNIVSKWTRKKQSQFKQSSMLL
jgi:predicted ATP-grasp superfamily ATP-dependent carboligase